MSLGIVLLFLFAYLSLLFGIAWWTDRRVKLGSRMMSNPAFYAMSLAVYCTAWTFYGSVGKASTSGISFIAVYLGPTLLMPLMFPLFQKVIGIAKAQNLTSIADFISARYGKHAMLGILVTLFLFVSMVPYIALQLKAIATTLPMLLGESNASAMLKGNLQDTTAFYTMLVMALFSVLFGTRNLDPNERHDGLVAAISFESLIKLVAFLAVGIFVTFVLYKDPVSLFQDAQNTQSHLFKSAGENIHGWDWFFTILLSAFATLLLPRQFHIGVVENQNVRHVKTAVWLYPLYLLLINIFVLPVAIAGNLLFTDGSTSADTYVLSIPLSTQHYWLALLVFIGGFSAAMSMVIVETVAMSIMMSNHLFMPYLLRMGVAKDKEVSNLSFLVLTARRLSIFLVLIASYAYYSTISDKYTLVSIGMISFAGVSQLAPAFLGGLFWTGANRKGAVAGIVTGFLLWALLLPFPLLAQAGLLPSGFIESGYLGISWLQPFHLFGMQDMDAITNGAFWSLLLNTLVFVLVSIYAQPEIQELSQADFFVHFKKYFKGQHEPEVVRREARMEDVVYLLHKFLGEERTQLALRSYGKEKGLNTNMLVKADSDLVNYVETILSGALGAPSARLVIDSIAKSAPISLDELVAVLNQTQEIMEYSKALEVKSKQLEETTHRLQAANQQLLELDQLKADFITTVTHELRTPVTSIKALARILFDHPELEIARRDQYLDIIVQESERITRLINQVLDIEKIQTQQNSNRELVDLNELAEIAAATVVELMTQKEIVLEMNLGDSAIQVLGQRDRIMQVLINLLSNAIKFCPEHGGNIQLSVQKQSDIAILTVSDNGIGIKEEDQKKLFEKFSQLHDGIGGKPGGSGLGLYISRQIVEAHGGRISVNSQPGNGASFKVEWPLAN